MAKEALLTLPCLPSRHQPGWLGSQGRWNCGEWDARSDEDEGAVRRDQATEGRTHRRLPPHDPADGRAHRDPHRPRCRGNKDPVAKGNASKSSRIWWYTCASKQLEGKSVTLDLNIATSWSRVLNLKQQTICCMFRAEVHLRLKILLLYLAHGQTVGLSCWLYLSDHGWFFPVGSWTLRSNREQISSPGRARTSLTFIVLAQCC